jgi:hypothetical protein
MEIIVAPRFCGPAGSANGGYFAGIVAAVARQSVAVRLLKPPPLGVGLSVEERGDGVLDVRHGGDVIAQTRPATLDAPALLPPSYEQAIEASRRYVGFRHHPFPTCFVCGPQRQRGDGLRVFPGAVTGRELVAAPWVPDDSLRANGGKVRAEFMWAALDCPGWLATVTDARLALLGELTAHVNRCVYSGEPCVVVGWRIGNRGRSHDAGTALFDQQGDLCGYARATWIEPRPAA